MKKVYLSADDFGRSRERNYAIDKAIKKNIVKSAGLIVTGQYLQDALDYIKNGGYVNKVHLHFNLSGNIVGDDSKDVPLTESMKRDSLFCENQMFRRFTRIPKSFKSIVRFHVVYKELVAQYNKFIEVTGGKGNYGHVDFHLWYNLSWPVSIALNIFTWNYRIKSVRYIGIHHEHNKRRLYRIIRKVSWNPFVKSYHSSNIDCYLSRPEWFEKFDRFELYCHPDFQNGQLLDNTISYFGHEKQLLETHYNRLVEDKDIVLVSWAET